MRKRSVRAKRGGRAGRPFGETTNSGRGLMTAQTKSFDNKPMMKITGKPARSNSIKNLKGRASKNHVGVGGKGF